MIILSKQYSITNDVLRSSNIGYRYGNHAMGVYCYADDFSLLSPTLSGLKEMLD